MREQIGAWSSVGDDLSDAYCHFRLAPEELCHCIAPSLEEDKLVIFKAMSFGFKGAPLIMGRLASAPRGSGKPWSRSELTFRLTWTTP